MSTLYLGNKPCILLTGYETFKEAFVEQADIFTDRPYFPLVDKLSKGKGTDAEKAILQQSDSILAKSETIFVLKLNFAHFILSV